MQKTLIKDFYAYIVANYNFLSQRLLSVLKAYIESDHFGKEEFVEDLTSAKLNRFRGCGRMTGDEFEDIKTRFLAENREIMLAKAKDTPSINFDRRDLFTAIFLSMNTTLTNTINDNIRDAIHLADLTIEKMDNPEGSESVCEMLSQFGEKLQ